jgi:phage-related minor tail protein
MSPEEVQRTMQFLLNQQAQFAADLGNVTDELKTVTAGLTRVTTHLEVLTERTTTITDGVIGLTSIVGNLAGQQQQTDQQIRDVEGQLKLLADMFERHLREDHGPRPS